jgi:hypothetical protein
MEGKRSTRKHERRMGHHVTYRKVSSRGCAEIMGDFQISIWIEILRLLKYLNEHKQVNTDNI